MNQHAPIIQILPDAAALAQAAADLLVRFVQDATVNRGRVAVALSGGQTPQGLFAVLAGPPHSTRLDFAAIDLFFVDERCVGPDDERSNYYQLRRLLLDPARIPPQRVHRIRGELDPAAAADEYDAELRRYLTGGDWPVFDLIVLGMGRDGHTASMFPGQPSFPSTARWVVPADGAPPVRRRVTLTLPAINHARQIVFLVDGPDKAAAAARVLAGTGDADLPAALVRPAAGQVRWLLTESAAGSLGSRQP